MSATYTKKVKKILERLDAGETREEIADSYSYSSWKSLDVYMRRKGFRYDGEDYVPDEPEEKSIVPENASSKEALIISLFDSEKDPRAIAKQTGFSDHRELADFMEQRGYSWSSSAENYLQEKSSARKEEKVTSSETTVAEEKEPQMQAEEAVPASIQQLQQPGELAILGEFLPLLRKLKAKEEKLDLLLASGSDGKVPKYAVPGKSTTKSIYMSSKLVGLLEEFSDLRNVSQREIVEGALVEYLQTYGFSEETDALLGRK
jgi:ribosome assembly protein YihI (activator of Der GTPase)